MESHVGLNTLDYIVFGTLLLSGLLALMRGFVRELFSLVAWIGAYFAALKYYPLFVPWMHHHIKNDKIAELVAMATVYAVSLVLLLVIGGVICHYAVRGRTLTAIDRSLGFLYGLLRGAVVVSLVYFLTTVMIWPDIDAPKQQSPQPAQQVSPAPQTQAQTDVNGQQPTQAQQDHSAPPDLLLEAKTRPLMAFGARELATLIPKDMLDKTLQNLNAQKPGVQKEMDQKTLDMLSTPTTAAHAPGSDATEHLDVNHMIDQGAKP